MSTSTAAAAESRKPVRCPTCGAEQVTVYVRNDGHSPADFRALHRGIKNIYFLKTPKKRCPKLELAAGHHLLHGQRRESAPCHWVRPVPSVAPLLHYSRHRWTRGIADYSALIAAEHFTVSRSFPAAATGGRTVKPLARSPEDTRKEGGTFKVRAQ